MCQERRPTSEVDDVRQALWFLRRQSMVDAGRCRGLVSNDLNRVRAMFHWAVEHELLPVMAYQAMWAVAALGQGRSEARETEPIGPVPEDGVRATLPHLSARVALGEIAGVDRGVLHFRQHRGDERRPLRPAHLAVESSPLGGRGRLAGRLP
ncbi:hypothetical protein TA3x_001624 [Tundrisphaera sp. TA3]|uniref:hypothetical protein n=1 Tax=Tundrisphaera sp. TA3 TaxID=3435775 RepID=UPI003EC0C9C7